MSFSEFVMLPIKRLQVYSHTLEVFSKRIFESEDCNVELLQAAATLNKKLKTMRSTLLDYLQISTVSNSKIESINYFIKSQYSFRYQNYNMERLYIPKAWILLS